MPRLAIHKDVPGTIRTNQHTIIIQEIGKSNGVELLADKSFQNVEMRCQLALHRTNISITPDAGINPQPAILAQDIRDSRWERPLSSLLHYCHLLSIYPSSFRPSVAKQLDQDGFTESLARRIAERRQHPLSQIHPSSLFTPGMVQRHFPFMRRLRRKPTFDRAQREAQKCHRFVHGNESSQNKTGRTSLRSFPPFRQITQPLRSPPACPSSRRRR